MVRLFCFTLDCRDSSKLDKIHPVHGHLNDFTIRTGVVSDDSQRLLTVEGWDRGVSLEVRTP